MPCEMFPVGVEEKLNPAIKLFGNRLYIDQSPMELLVELLLVADAPKWIGEGEEPVRGVLPNIDQLLHWPRNMELAYAPRARLNLKLLAFMGASRLDSRHETHRQHFKELLERIKQNLRVADGGDTEDVLRTLESLFLGFHGAGGGRTWCAQSFAPISRGLLAGETIWNQTESRRDPPSSWEQVLVEHSKYLTMNRHRFLARGGEVLYLQICRALREPSDRVREWAHKSGVDLAEAELDPGRLSKDLGSALDVAMDDCPRTVAELADFLDRGIEPETARATDEDDSGRRKVKAGCCADESWQEGYLFAIDLLRLCKADLDPMERLSLMEAACALQVLRTLAAQSARHCADERKESCWPGYRLAFSAPQEHRAAIKRISRDSARMAERMIHHAIRADEGALPAEPDDRARKLREADRRYGGKLFTGLCKRIGLLVPRRGAGARFTLDERILRLLVATTVPVGGRLQYDTFKRLVEARHGFVFDADGLNRAAAWSSGADPVNLGGGVDTWLREMLEAAGLLVELSDSCSLVKNPAQKKGGAA